MTDTPDSRDPAAPSIGEDLRRERELRGISLKEIADATKISKRFLEAIEKSDYKTLPAPVFTRGFVREYAKYLGLNAEEFVARYSQKVAVEQAIAEGNEPSPQRPERHDRVERPSQEIPRPYKKIDRNLIWAVVILVAIIGAIWAVREQRLRQTVRSAATLTSTEAIAAPAPEPKPVQQTQPPPKPQPDLTGGLVMEVRVTRPSWVALEADGKTVLYEELKPGFRQTVRAESDFRFRTIGNAAGLDLTINGLRVPALGEEGEVIKDRTFDLDYVRELASSQTPQP